MLICENCGNIHTKENAKVKKQYLCEIDGDVMTEEILVCRNCDTMLVEAKICPACERIYIAYDEEICADCWNEAQTLDTCLEIGADDGMGEQYTLNGFLASVFSQADIERILTKHFINNLSIEEENKHIYKYLNDDRGFLADWLAEKREKDNANIH